MSKKVLAIYYSQTGQLEQITDNFLIPFYDKNFSVEKINVKMEKEFAFPWSTDIFFDAMPESVLEKPAALKPFQTKEKKYDLIVFGYQPWFLSPSIPATSILKDSVFKTLVHNTPLVTLVGARNMWLNAHEKVKVSLKESGAKWVGNIVLTDKHSNLVSAVTIVHWMMKGKKTKKWGIFPVPGVSAPDIQNAKVFGNTVSDFLKKGTFEGMQAELVQQKALEVKANLLFIESKAGKLFPKWANLISRKQNRKRWLKVFKYYLIIALFVVSPILVLLNMILFRPFMLGKLRRKKQYFLGLN